MTPKLIFSNDADFISDQLKGVEGPVRYVVLSSEAKSAACERILGALPQSISVPERNILDDNAFIREYSLFLAGINGVNSSRTWYAMYFTNKNPILTPLCRNVYDFMISKVFCGVSGGGVSVVVSSNTAVCSFVKSWAERRNVAAAVKVNGKSDMPAALKILVRIAYDKMRLLGRIIAAKMMFKKPARAKLDFLILTQFEKNAFKDNGSFKDAYFERLSEYLRSKKRKFVTCGFAPYSFRNVLKKKNGTMPHELMPLELFLNIFTIGKISTEVFSWYLKKKRDLKGSFIFMGEDIKALICSEIDRSYVSGEVFMNTMVYHSVKNMLEVFSAGRMIYPFENRSWEKMAVIAARDSGDVKTIAGYQHASLTPKHINFYFGDGEISYTPFPDKVISMGKVSYNLMKDVFGIPERYLGTGCALRQAADVLAPSGTPGAAGKTVRVFVPLASDVDEYVNMLKFIDAAALSFRGKYEIVIRPHPAIEFESALKIYTPENFTYIIETGKSIKESIAEAGVVLYASSTLGIEALAAGVPVIYADFGAFLNSDPLNWFRAYKWSCSDPNNLEITISLALSGDDRHSERERADARQYAADYFYPVNEENLKPFILEWN